MTLEQNLDDRVHIIIGPEHITNPENDFGAESRRLISHYTQSRTYHKQ